MARYVSLIRFTDQGSRNIRQSTARALAFKKAAEKAGLKIELQLWTVGNQDGLLILNGDEKKVVRTLAQLSALGNVKTQTMQAFNAQEFQAMLR